MQTHVQQSVQGYTAAQKGLCGLFNHAVLEELHGSVTGNDLWGAVAAQCARCKARDKIQAKAFWQEMVKS